jgi:Ca2+-binding RTX toxin-like protein
MIEIKALKPQSSSVQTAEQIYRAPEAEVRPARWVGALLLAMAAIATYVASLFPTYARSTPELAPEQPEAKGSEAAPVLGAAAEDETGALGEGEKEPPLGSGNPSSPVGGIADFLGIDSPPIDYEQLPLPRSDPPAVGFGLDQPSNDNRLARNFQAVQPAGDNGGGASRPASAFSGETGGAIPLKPVSRPPQPDRDDQVAADESGGEGSDEKPRGDGLGVGSPSPNDRPSRNQAPVLRGAVTLPSIGMCETLLVSVAALLSGAFDADGDTLSIVNLRVSSGTLKPVEGGWLFTPSAGAHGPISLHYEVSDGTVAVAQTARFEVIEFTEINGTPADDILIGAECADIITGGDGADNIHARGGSDIIHGGLGNDHIVAGAGNDLVHAGAGDDIVFGGAGNDVIHGGAGNDRIFGDDGDDVIHAEDGDDLAFGGAGNDQISGGAGNDEIHGEDGDDTLAGDEGDDVISGGAGADMIDGGSGHDRLSGGTSGDILFGGAGDDEIRGEDGDDFIDGGAGDDEIDGGSGNNIIQTGSGKNRVVAGDGDNTVIGGSGQDTVRLGAGRDIVRLGCDDDLADAGAGDDRIFGEDGDDKIFAGAGDDIVSGGAGNDIIDAGAGADQADGDEGDDSFVVALDQDDDRYDGGAGNDTLDLSGTRQGVEVNAVTGTVKGSEIGKDIAVNIEAIIGGKGDDSFVVGDKATKLTGGEGDDTFVFAVSLEDEKRDLIHEILDLDAGDRIVVKQYQIRSDVDEEDAEEEGEDDRFSTTYGDEDDARPFRFRIEKVDGNELTFVDVYLEQDEERDYSIQIVGNHKFYYF